MLLATAMLYVPRMLSFNCRVCDAYECMYAGIEEEWGFCVCGFWCVVLWFCGLWFVVLLLPWCAFLCLLTFHAAVTYLRSGCWE